MQRLITPKLQILHRTIKRLLLRGAADSLERVLARTHAADLGSLLGDLSARQRTELIDHCRDDERRAAVLAAAEPTVAAELLAEMARERAVELLRQIEPDDTSDILECMDDGVAEQILDGMRAADRAEVENLSRYESATAGGIMSPRFFSLNRETTAADAISHLQTRGTDLEMVFYVYVVNELGHLLGVVSLRQLVTARPETRLFDLMTSDVIRVAPEVDQEEVAKLASRYGLLAIPVVDSSNRLVGIVTVDDLIDVLREEATEDILRMAGAGDELQQHNVFRSALTRFPWLLATGVGGVLSAFLLGIYVTDVAESLMLVLFLPLVLGLTGVAGLQSAAVIAQGIAQGKVGSRLAISVLRQAAIGSLLGLVYGALATSAAALWAWQAPGQTGTAPPLIGLGVSVAMAAATVIGSLLPALFERIRLDPALASGPFVAIIADLAGLWVYLAFGVSLGS